MGDSIDSINKTKSAKTNNVVNKEVNGIFIYIIFNLNALLMCLFLGNNNNDDDETHSNRLNLSKADAELYLSNTYMDLISFIGEDPNRQGLQKTPMRAAKAMLQFTKGYTLTIKGRLL